MADYTDYITAIEAMSGGTNKVIFDDVGLPSIMAAFPKLRYSDVFTGELATDETLPAFIVGEVERDVIWISKYQNIVINGRAYSLPSKIIKGGITFDASTNACRKKGNGWTLMPNSVWAAIALWCNANGTIPYGNNYSGRDVYRRYEKAIPTAYDSSGKITKTRTGSGPASWYHNNNYSGIADLNGNIMEWTSGFRVAGGEIQIIANADAFLPTVGLSTSGLNWTALLSDGTTVPSGTGEALKFDYTSNRITITSGNITNPSSTDFSCAFKNIYTDEVILPKILKALAIYPDDTYSGDSYVQGRNDASNTYYMYRGGNYARGTKCGVFMYMFYGTLTASSSDIGFRSAFCELA